MLLLFGIIQRGSCVALVVHWRALGRDALLAIWDLRFQTDMFFEVLDQEMIPLLQSLQQMEGLAIGGSGVNVAGNQVAKELGPGHTIVTVLCDRADRYATKLYNSDFLNSRGLPVPKWVLDNAGIQG